MFEELMESERVRRRPAAQTAVSIVFHLIVIAVSIQLTRAAAAVVAKRPVETTMILTRAPRPVEMRTVSTAGTTVSVPAPVAITPSARIVVSVPPINLDQHGSSQPDFSSYKSGTPSGLPDDRAPIDQNMIVTLAQADEPTRYLDGPLPSYPPALKQVGVEGSVQLQYVVGIDGRVEPRSLIVVSSTNKAFEGPAIEAIMAAHFRPARIHGHDVRQLVEQVVRFTVR